jgi:DNA-binding beta-propeller fold protein YncE
MILGGGEYRYEPVEAWPTLPDGMVLGDVGSVGVDSSDRVYVFNRGPHPIMVFDREGAFLRSWGAGEYRRPHGLQIGPDDSLYLTDELSHTVRKCTPEGRLLLELGSPGKPAAFLGGEPFNRCTHTALSPEGDIYVSDGYGNGRVHKFAADGRRLLSWGETGSDPGQFNVVHNICCDGDGWVYVADRENHRIQVFDGDGNYETQWNNLHRPCGLFMPPGKSPVCYIGELGPGLAVNRHYRNLGPRVSIVDRAGRLLARIGGDRPGAGAGRFVAPHGIATDQRGDIYVGEVAYGQWANFFDEAPPDGLPTLRKFRRLGPLP